MNKKLFFTALLACSLNFLLCAQNVREELLNYINKGLPKVGKLEHEALSAYGAVTGDNYQDDNTTYNAITKTVIPTYLNMIDKLKSLSKSLKTEEIHALNEIYVAGAKIQLNAFNMIIEGLKKGDTNIVQLANKKLERARRLLEEWSDEMSELCQYYNIVIQ